MLKIFYKAPNTEGDAVPFLFHFNSPSDARSEANAIKDLLSRILADARNHDQSVPRPSAAAAAANGSPAAIPPTAGPVNSKANSNRLFDDNHLKSDIELQQSLLKKDKTLHQTYMDALQTKPDTISNAVFNTRFWSTRFDLLRSYAIEANQQRGAYNVLPTMKTRTIQDEETGQEKVELNINVAEITQIFNQHPIVKRIYNENVPKVPEAEFWSRFFLSRLCKHLKGERVSDTDRLDNVFDKYDANEDSIAYSSKILAQHVAPIIDLEANEENQGGFKSGNRKDVEMRPRKNVPIVQVLNATSEKLLSNVAPSDQDPTIAATMDDETFQELSLRDLRDDAEQNRIILNIKEQSQFFSDQNSAETSGNARVYEKQVPAKVLSEVTTDLGTLEDDQTRGIDLHGGIGVDEDSDSDEETPKKPHVGSRAARKSAQKQILHGLAQSRAELYGHNSDETSPMGIPAELTQKAYITNATTTEFLKQFWAAFLSGDPDRAQELGYHVESLRRSVKRIEAIAEEAEQARDRVLEQKRKELRDQYTKTRVKSNWKAASIGGGRQAVLTLLGPSLKALGKAQSLYNAALAAEGIAPSTENE